MANDLLDDNGCSIILQSFDDVAMELVFFARGSNLVSILAKKYMYINNICIHNKLGKVLYTNS